MAEKRTALNQPRRKTSLDEFWDSMSEPEKKAWPKELKKMMKESMVFPGYKSKESKK